MTTTPAQVAAVVSVRAPQFADNVNLTALCEQALTFAGKPFRSKRAYAAAMLVCHWLTLAANASASGSAGSGSLKMEREGELIKEFSGPPTGWDGFLSMTPWGIEFEFIRRGVIMGSRTSATPSLEAYLSC